MIKFILGILKYSLLIIIILLLGNYLTLDGKTVNDQIRTRMAQIQHSPTIKKVKEKTDEFQNSEKERLKDLIESFSK